STPMTPANHFPQTPFMPSGGDYRGIDMYNSGGQGAGSSSDADGDSSGRRANGAGAASWVTTDIEVEIVPSADGGSFEGGRYNNMTGRLMEVLNNNSQNTPATCKVKLNQDDNRTTITISAKYLEPVKPTNGDGVKILSGLHQGGIGN